MIFAREETAQAAKQSSRPLGEGRGEGLDSPSPLGVGGDEGPSCVRPASIERTPVGQATQTRAVRLDGRPRTVAARCPWACALGLAGFLICVWLPLALLLWEVFAGATRPPVLDARFLGLLANSLVVAGGAAALALLMGTPTGILLGRASLPGRSLLIALQVAPILVPSYVAAIGWLHVLGRAGPLNEWLMALLQLSRPPLDPYTAGGAIWVLGLGGFPVVALIVMAAVEQLNPDLEEVALLEVGPWRVLRQVTLPQTTPAALGAGLLVFLFALGDFAVPSFFGINVYTVEVFVRFGAFFDFRAGTVAALPLLALAVLAFAGQRRLLDRLPFGSGEASQMPRRRLSLGRWTFPVACACALPALAAALVPLLALAWRAPSAQDYALAWEVAETEVTNSLGFAVLAATAAVALGLPLAWLAARGGPASSRAGEALSLSPVAVPGLVVGIGMIRLWNRGAPFLWVYQSLGIVVLGMLGRALPFAIAALAASWRQLPAIYEESARQQGASTAQVARFVLLPLLRPGLAIAWCLAFVAAIGELQTTLLVYPPGCATLPVRIFTLQHDGQVEHVAALCLILLAIAALPALLVWRLARPRE